MFILEIISQGNRFGSKRGKLGFCAILHFDMTSDHLDALFLQVGHQNSLRIMPYF